MQEILTNLCRYCWGWLFPYSSVFSLWLKLNSACEERSWFFVFTFVFVCILVPYILLTNVCRSTYVSCQLCVVLFPFHPGPTARSSPDLRFGPDCPLPLLSTNPCCSISHLPLPPFHRLNLPQPLQYPFLAGFPCTGACSNVQLHRKPLFTNQLPQVKPTVTRSFFFLQIFWQTNPKLWKSIRLKGRMSQNV